MTTATRNRFPTRVHENVPAPPAGAVPWDLVPLEQIDASPLNPRKTFDKAGLEELAASIKAKGVLQPILTRKVGERHEVVCGERRLRAAKLAGCTSIPVIVRSFTDREVLEIQVIENEQRADVAPLEKADGYWELTRLGLSVEELAAKIGKSPATIYSLLKLRKLPEQARKALAGGTLPASTASLIGRIPNDKLRADAAKRILKGGEHFATPGGGWHVYRVGPGPMSLRDAKLFIEAKYTVELKSAPFDRKALDLVPSAGACTACPKMTGNNRAEFPDARGDICTDPGCYQQKVEANNDARLDRYRQAGVNVIEGHPYKVAPSSKYIRLDDEFWDGKRHRGYKQALKPAIEAGELAITAFLDQDTGEISELVPRPQAEGLVRKLTKGSSRSSASSHSASMAKHNAQAKIRAAARKLVMAAAAANVEERTAALLGFDDNRTALLRAIAIGVVDHSWNDTTREINARRGIEAKKARHGGWDQRGGLQELIPTLDARQVLGLLAEVVAARYAPGGAYHTGTLEPEAQTFFKAIGVDYAKAVACAKLESKGKAKKAKAK